LLSSSQIGLTITTSITNFNFIFSDDNSILKPIGWPKLKKKIDRLLKRNERLIAKFNSEKLRSIAKVQSEELTSTNNSRNIPSNATVRREYVRCGKEDCLAEHGPYYYAYWRDDSGKLKKKYIGKYHLAVGNTNKAKSSDMDHASRDTVTDPSISREVV
jgi:hypothetical protein